MTPMDRKPISGLPTRQDVLGWQEELARLKDEESAMKERHAAEEKAIRDRRGKLEKFVEYGMALVNMGALPESEPVPSAPPEHVSDSKPKTAPPRRRRKGSKTWTATIKRIVARNERGMTYGEVKDEVAKSHLGETLKRTDKAFYGAIGKLNERGDIVKYHGRLFPPKAFKKFIDDVNAGTVADIPEPSGSLRRRSPNEIAIERFLERRPDGATTSEIVNSLLNSPPEDLKVTKNRNSIYNLLSRQRRNGSVIRRGDLYFLPSRQDEAPGSFEPSASNVHHGDDSGVPSSSGRGKVVTFSSARPGAIPAQSGE